MELDEMKTLWQQAPGKIPENLGQYLGRRSVSPIAKMKRNLLGEVIITVLAYGAVVLYYFISWNGRFSSISWLYLAIALVVLGYFMSKFRLLSQMECMSCQVKSNLSRQVNTLGKYIRFYLIAGTIQIPLIIMFFYWFFYMNFHGNGPDTLHLPNASRTLDQSLLYWSVITTIITIVFYFLNRWYVHKLYGRQVEALRKMLDQMEDDPAYNA